MRPVSAAETLTGVAAVVVRAVLAVVLVSAVLLTPYWKWTEPARLRVLAMALSVAVLAVTALAGEAMPVGQPMRV